MHQALERVDSVQEQRPEPTQLQVLRSVNETWDGCRIWICCVKMFSELFLQRPPKNDADRGSREVFAQDPASPELLQM